MIERLTTRFPVLTASAVYLLAVILAFNRFFAGQVLIPELSDQRQGYPPRLFAAEYFREYGSIPEWQPYIFGGFPFVSNTGFGDTFFPTFLLRLILPVDQGMALGMILFIFLAGVFAFLFFRSLNLSWGASFVGGAAYMFTGMVISLVSPGHDGKIFVSAMMPLALMFLYKGVTRADWRQYLYFGVVVGFSLLSPSFQASYYMLMAAGFFWLFMVFLSGEKAASETWWRASLLFAGGLAVGFAIAAVQLMPFLEYLPFSPRGDVQSSSQGWAYATSYSTPPEEVIGVVLPGFNSFEHIQYYYGRNPFKLHSDYVGLVVALLALASFRLTNRRRMAWFFVFLAGYGLLFAFGGHTPFYRIPYTLLPMIAKTRAPSIIFFLVSFSIVALAAFGTEYLLNRAGDAAQTVKKAAQKAAQKTAAVADGIDRTVLISLGVFTAIAVLAMLGAAESVMLTIANMPGPRPAELSEQSARAIAAGFPARMWIALILACAAAALTLPGTLRSMGRAPVALLLGLVVLLDLWMIERRYIRFSPRAAQVMPADEVVAALKADTTVHRVMPVATPYMENYFMAHGLRTSLGHNAFEIHAYDELMGGKNSWLEPLSSNILNPKLWDLIGVRYVVFDGPLPPADSVPEQIRPMINALTPVGHGLKTYDGGTASLYRITNPVPYALLVPMGWKVQATYAQVVATLMSPGFDARRLLLLPDSAGVGRDSMTEFGPPADNYVHVAEQRPGRLSLRFDRAAGSDAFLYVAENFSLGWKARSGGSELRVVPAQASLMAIPISAGTSEVELTFSSPGYHRGRLVSLVSIIVVAGMAAYGWYAGRRERRRIS